MISEHVSLAVAALHQVDASARERIAKKQASATSAKPAARASAAKSDARSMTKASTSGASAWTMREGPAMRPTTAP